MSDSADWRARTSGNARRHQELDQRLAGLSITESSRDGSVRVTVSAGGLLTGLVLAEPAGPVSGPRLAAEIMDCVRRAQAKIPDLLQQVLAESVGTDDPDTHLLVADARRRFPEPPPFGGGPAAPPPRRAVHEQWDDERPSVWDM
ncbi:YbaB/EbfC family nucleoid-associated protein [Saccharothrix syringae]|uniref:YbaB/EbfC family DNA-binding protein n=1 Tax=Saccharothrix syringae TaxID=103733 RepID=A0A5Q0H4W5_SACSY|nr:YbaB/EbfC family nucleoid-associated protein [Saccharothrix syringae]QFZ21043.1 YbaB/EbfC family DNA-binding protein [Saccharothrix syringae]